MEHIFDKGVTVKNFVKFVWPSVLMMVVIALYYGFDSVFVANLVGETALASLSIAYPAQGIMWGVAVMLAAGSSDSEAHLAPESKWEREIRKRRTRNTPSYVRLRL